MPTSFAPSPMASRMSFERRFTSSTTSAFWSGETRQHTTARHCAASGRNKSASASSCSTCCRLCPSTTSANSSAGARSSARWASAVSRLRCSASPVSAGAASLTTSTLIDSEMSRQEYPMLIAVSCRSPVSTQTLIPAVCSVAIVSGTPSWSRSSIAVAPSSSRSRSTSSAARSSASTRPCTLVAAASYRCAQTRYSSSASSRFAMHSVRRPSPAYVSSAATVASRHACCAPSRGSSTVSAPLQKSVIRPSGRRTTVDMRFRAEVNSHTCSTSYSCGAPCTSMYTERGLRAVKLYPSACAPATSAASSGEEAWNVTRPSRVSGITVWHTASSVRNSSQAAPSASPPPSTVGSCAQVRSPLTRRPCASRSSGAASSRAASRNETPPIAASRNCITFRVRVPVLSLKMWSTWPSSSTRLDRRHCAGVSLASSYISRSELISSAWLNLTNSIVTISEIGIRLLYRIMNVRIDSTNARAPLRSSSCGMRYCALWEKAVAWISAPIALITESASSRTNSAMISAFTWPSTRVRFVGVAVVLRISLVSCPVNTARPYAQGAFRSCAPRRSSWSGPTGTAPRPARPSRCSVPSNVCRLLFGGSHSSRPRSVATLAAEVRPAVAGGACRTLRFVSPSRFAVSTYARPSGSELASSTRSAGKKSSRSTRTTSPTRTSRQRRGAHVFSSGSSTSTVRALSSASDMARRQSSLISLSALASSTMPSGTSVVQRFVGDTFGICWMHPMKRKNTFAYLENSSNRNRGTNVTTLYLFVVTMLSQKSSTAAFAAASFSCTTRVHSTTCVPRSCRSRCSANRRVVRYCRRASCASSEATDEAAASRPLDARAGAVRAARARGAPGAPPARAGRELGPSPRGHASSSPSSSASITLLDPSGRMSSSSASSSASSSVSGSYPRMGLRIDDASDAVRDTRDGSWASHPSAAELSECVSSTSYMPSSGSSPPSESSSSASPSTCTGSSRTPPPLDGARALPNSASMSSIRGGQ